MDPAEGGQTKDTEFAFIETEPETKYTCQKTRSTEKNEADKKAADDKKAAEEKELKEKKNARAGLCLAMVATSELLAVEDIPDVDNFTEAAN